MLLHYLEKKAWQQSIAAFSNLLIQSEDFYSPTCFCKHKHFCKYIFLLNHKCHHFRRLRLALSWNWSKAKKKKILNIQAKVHNYFNHSKELLSGNALPFFLIEVGSSPNLNILHFSGRTLRKNGFLEVRNEEAGK